MVFAETTGKPVVRSGVFPLMFGTAELYQIVRNLSRTFYDARLFPLPVGFLFAGIGMVFRIAAFSVGRKQKGCSITKTRYFCRTGIINPDMLLTLAVVGTFHLTTWNDESFTFPPEDRLRRRLRYRSCRTASISSITPTYWISIAK